jgi:L-serine/L-threonine ammonia-lyase
LRRVGWNDTQVFAVEPEHAAALGPSLQAKRVLELSQPRSIASSLCVMRPAPSLVDACQGRRVSALTVSDEDSASACARFANEQGLLVEPACGVALAPIYNRHPALASCKNVVAIVCGGIVVTLEQLAEWSNASH